MLHTAARALSPTIFPRPRSFAKGPCYFLSAELASQLGSERVGAEAARALASGGSPGGSSGRVSGRARAWAWEDVFVGMALAALVEVGGVTMVHVGGAVFAEQQARLALANSTLVWHDKRLPLESPRWDTRMPERMHAAQRWARLHHCDAVLRALDCHEYTACGGARWRRCVASYATAAPVCPTRLVDLPDPPLRGRASLEAHSIRLETLPIAVAVRSCRQAPRGTTLVLGGEVHLGASVARCSIALQGRPP
mmetsp:Transcript_48789/g.158052  ORF Transcript_48789/g.158052 Transcript_48789/m.158052 type:complete len:252 (+) Transcript_48789:646-1401(+)